MSIDVANPFVFGRSSDQEEELLDKIYQALSGVLGNNTTSNTMNQQQIPGPFLYGPYTTRKAELLDKILQASQAIVIGGGGGGSWATITAANPQYNFLQNEVAEYIIMYSTNPLDSINLLMGTTVGGNELFEGQNDPGQYLSSTLFIPFPANTTVYFTNMTPTTVIKIKKSQI